MCRLPFGTIYEFLPFAGGDPVDSQGEIGVPDMKSNFTATYGMDNLQVAWSTRYRDSVNIENDQLAFGDIGSYVYHDLHASYVFGSGSRYRVFLGVDNVFDKSPPVLGRGIPGDGTGTNTAADVCDAIRRYYYVGFNGSFDL